MKPHAYQIDGVWYRAGRRIWTAAEDVRMRREYPDTPTTDLAKALQRSLTAVYGRARILGLAKSAAYRESPAACRLRRGDNIGAQFRFRKGIAPANKGLRRPGWHRGRMKQTWFKPGQRSGKAAAHYMPIGSTRLVDGYVYRKVSDVPNVPYTVNWKPENHLVWTAAHGPIPPGHILKFRNGDKTDCRLENLYVMPRRELMARNSVHNLPKPLKSAIHLLAQLKRRIRERTSDAQSSN